MFPSLEAYRQEVRLAAAIHSPDNPNQWIEDQLAYVWFADDVDRKIEYQRFKDSLRDGEAKLARRETITTKEGNCHE
jgi:hypothetical protein